MSFESHHYNQAFAQFSALGGQGKPTMVEYWENEPLGKRFVAAEARLAQQPGAVTSKTWVFHGTKEEVVPQIMEGGFKIGGVDGHAVANASAYGKGVYTATGPNAPQGYVKGGKKVILAKGLKGRFQDVKHGDANADSWRGGGEDWCIFRNADQLLPVYVVHYSSDS